MKRNVLRAITMLLALSISFLAAGCGSSGDNTNQPTGTASPSASSTGGEAPVISVDDGAKIASEWLQLCIDGKFDEAYEASNNEMKAVWDSYGGIEAAFEQIEASMGKMQSAGEPDASESEDGITSKVKVACEQMPLIATITVNGDKQISYVLLQPDSESSADAEKAQLPDGVSEREIIVDAGSGYPLDGLLTYPASSEGKLPCVVLVQGSGASGMDQVVGSNRTFEQYANALASRGLAVIRYDKRTYAHATCTNKADFSVKDEYVEDVIAAVELAKQQPECDPDKIYILGHSMGGMLAPRFYDEGADVAGMVIFAGTPRSLVDLLKDQQQMLLDEQTNMSEQEMEEYEAQRIVWRDGYDELMAMDEDAAKQSDPVYEMPAWYIYEMDKYTQPIDLIKKNNIPVLIMQGGKDMQVYADKDFVLYQEGLADFDKAAFKLYPNLNHLFMPSEAAGLLDGMEEYNTLSSVPAEVMDDIAEWISGQN